MTFQVTSELVSKILDTVDAGLVKGLGEAQPGKMCIEAAVCYAMGLPHSDEPTCVGSAVREFKIIINDAKWSSDQARAAGMRKLAVAQLGSDTIDQEAFYEKVVFQTIKQILPEMFKDLAEEYPDEAEVYLLHSNACSEAKDLVDAKKAACAAYSDDVCYDAFSYDAICSISLASSTVCHASLDNIACLAHIIAMAYAAEAVELATEAIKTDKYLLLGAEIALQVLKDLKSPGCQFLYMCD